ncbi:MAG: hypothetical protein Pg6B_06410 [Candidatus Azobacteroides pseudotrichonymphae]|jgi:c-di-AMP phosphodiesterase-like protein|nr:MAG: hypothetical protein Pg6B_06410 [Candidatus Azobacteroides pseudotrichonymphae]
MYDLLKKIFSYQFPIFVLVGIISIIIHILFKWLIIFIETCIFAVGLIIEKISEKKGRYSNSHRNDYKVENKEN